MLSSKWKWLSRMKRILKTWKLKRIRLFRRLKNKMTYIKKNQQSTRLVKLSLNRNQLIKSKQLIQISSSNSKHQITSKATISFYKSKYKIKRKTTIFRNSPTILKPETLMKPILVCFSYNSIRKTHQIIIIRRRKKKLDNNSKKLME